MTTQIEHHKSKGRNSQSYLARGNTALREGKYDEAIELFKSALQQTPVLSNIIEFNIALASKYLSCSSYELSGEETPGIQSQPSVDVVVPVYNALEDVQRCLAAIEEHTDGYNVTTYIINDGSDTPTTEWLREFCSSRLTFFLTENPENKGYTPTINIGLRKCKSDYIVTLNSDTIVTPGWISGLINCLESDHSLGIVGPLSNAASWQSVPRLKDDDGNFFINVIPDGYTLGEFADLVLRVSSKAYPKMKFINGFCFMLKRQVLEKIGFMDEANFPLGYGEENDFCIRALDAGYSLAVADDVYVFHAKSKSFGHAKRQELSRAGSENLKKKHGDNKYSRLVEQVKDTRKLDVVRSLILDEIARARAQSLLVPLSQLNILFLLPVSGGGGGTHSVIQEVTAMRKLGVNAKVAVKTPNLNTFLSNYSDIPDAPEMFIGFNDDTLFLVASKFDIVVATIFKSVKTVKEIVTIYPHILPAYYIQDYEPLFFDEGSEFWSEAYNSYNLVPGIYGFAKTDWIIDQVKKNHNLIVHKVTPSIDHEVYKPAPQKAGNLISIVAMIRPQTPYRGAERTMQLLRLLKKKHGRGITIDIFGCESSHADFEKLPRDFEFVNHGVLKRMEVAQLLAAGDMFIDLSDYQAFGRTALEAMACGSTAVVPCNGGTYEYAIHDKNCLVVDTLNVSSC